VGAPRILRSGSRRRDGKVKLDGGYVSLECGVSQQTRRELIKKGHKISDALGSFGGYQAIMYDSKNKVYYGASESRKDGHAAGY